MSRATEGVARWFLSPEERGNPAAWLYAGAEVPWSEGNEVTPLVDGEAYFSRLCSALRGLGTGDQVYFADWRGDPDERLDGPGSAVLVELGRAQSAGAQLHGLVWRSHLDRLRFSEEENRDLAQGLQALNALVLLDMRVRRGGSHHQKFVVIRHRHRPDLDVAFVGGIDLGHGRRDGHQHRGDPQRLRLAAAYGSRPPWHDVMLQLRGPVVSDVEVCLRERWADPAPLRAGRPWLWAVDRMRGFDGERKALPEPLPPPPPAGEEAVQLLRTYPRRTPAYPFAPRGERTVARGYAKALAGARRLVYVEDQFMWSTSVASVLATALHREPQLHLVMVVPRHPDGDGLLQRPAKDVVHAEAVELLRRVGGDRVHLFDVENEEGTPIYVHAKVCVVDDTWAAVGSANLNRRSWTHDSELAAAISTPGAAVGRASAAGLPARLRRQLWAEHLGRHPDDWAGLEDPRDAVHLLEEQARRLERWHADGRVGPRPAGRLRLHRVPDHSPVVELLAQPFVRTVLDPDARPRTLRRADRW